MSYAPPTEQDALDEFLNLYEHALHTRLKKEEASAGSVSKHIIEASSLSMAMYLLFIFFGALMVLFFPNKDARIFFCLIFVALFLWIVTTYSGLKEDCGAGVYNLLYKKESIEKFICEKEAAEIAAADGDITAQKIIRKKYSRIKSEFPYWKF